MSFQPDPLQRLVLWRLAVSDDGGEFAKKLETSSLTPARRKPLTTAGLVEEKKVKIGGKGAALIYFELTDKGWAWCQSHLGESFELKGQTPKLAAAVLERLLGLMKAYFETGQGVGSIGEFVLQVRSGGTAAGQNGQPESIADAIRRECLDLGQGRRNTRVRLADLRKRLSSVPRTELDETLRVMENNRELSLYSLDDPREITVDDREASLRTAAGNERHILYFGESGS